MGSCVQTEVFGSTFLCLMPCVFPWANVQAWIEVTAGGVVIEKCSASIPNAQTVLKIRKLWKKKNQLWELYFFLWLKQKGVETKGVMTIEPGIYLARPWAFARHIFGWGVCSCSHSAHKYNKLTELEFLTALPAAILGSLSNKESIA